MVHRRMHVAPARARSAGSRSALARSSIRAAIFYAGLAAARGRARRSIARCCAAAAPVETWLAPRSRRVRLARGACSSAPASAAPSQRAERQGRRSGSLGLLHAARRRRQDGLQGGLRPAERRQAAARARPDHRALPGAGDLRGHSLRRHALLRRSAAGATSDCSRRSVLHASMSVAAAERRVHRDTRVPLQVANLNVGILYMFAMAGTGHHRRGDRRLGVATTSSRCSAACAPPARWSATRSPWASRWSALS